MADLGEVGTVKAHSVVVVRLARKATICMRHLEGAAMGILEPVAVVSVLD